VGVTLALVAKSPEPGRVKTRLCPPCTPEQAASIARAAVLDTIDVMRAVDCARRVLVLDGPELAEIPSDVDVVGQRGVGLDERLAALFDDVGGPCLVIAMDTPHVTPALLGDAVDCLEEGADAVIGMSRDGGYWAVGLREPDADCFIGIPMHTAATGRAQHERLEARGREVECLPSLRDVDTFADAMVVAAEIPASRFAAAVRAVVVALDLSDEEAV
jgi:hypothetical protein